MQINQFHLGRMRWNAIVRFAQWTYVFSDWFAPFSIAYAAKPQRNVHVFFLGCWSLYFSTLIALNQTKIIENARLDSVVKWYKMPIFFWVNQFFVGKHTHTHKLSIEMFCCMNDGDAFAYAFWVTAFFSHLTFFFVYGLFFALSSPKYTTLSFFSPSISQLFFEIPTLFADLMALFCFKHRN